MKKFMLIAFVGSMAIFATSCEKCTTCSYELNGQTVTSNEICGDRSEINDFEDSWETSATAAGATNAKCD